MVDEIKKAEIKIYFVPELVLSEQQYDEIPYKKLLCTVEISPYGSRGPNAELTAKGIVKSMRIITIQDRATHEWVTFKPKNRQMLRLIQTVLCNEVIAKLELSPPNPNPASIAPKDVILGEY